MPDRESGMLLFWIVHFLPSLKPIPECDEQPNIAEVQWIEQWDIGDRVAVAWILYRTNADNQQENDDATETQFEIGIGPVTQRPEWLRIVRRAGIHINGTAIQPKP